ncbi:Hypp7625 [Branchiostoma lanceolatum]|uniref:DNA 3'-5' helicase n=1 Tax=Branchiostoma lanceolatum TaxID=7740 RepID=A0A8J9Z2J5_BRALA|nr:Hypp7625 [Branchiostoma lanceolatum]
MALTATATEAVRTAVKKGLDLTGEVVMGDLNRANITMGIDIPDMPCAITYGAPASISQLYQQMGRTGRNLQVKAAYIVYHTTNQQEKAKPEVASMLSEEGCLRKALLQHLGRRDIPWQERCCSNCGGIDPEASCLLAERQPPPPKAKKKATQGKNRQWSTVEGDITTTG